jgi:ADP-ribose pyrophosphatase YjhB (NUDIX family)
MPTFKVETAIVDNGRILLIKQMEAPCWRLPGGDVLAGTSAVESLMRLTKAQTGLDIRVGRLVGLYSRPRWRKGGDTTAVFLGLTIGGALQVGAQINEALHFFPRALPENLFPWYAQRIADVLAAQQRPFVRSEDIAWPFPFEEPDAVLAWLLQKADGDPALALREGLRLAGIKMPEAELARFLASDWVESRVVAQRAEHK